MKNLESFTIHQFRGIKELKLENLGQINILVGINNSGKTSVLEALSLYCNPLDIKKWGIRERQSGEKSQIHSFDLEELQWLLPQSKNSTASQAQRETISMIGQGHISLKLLSIRLQERSKKSIPQAITNKNPIIKDNFSEQINNLWIKINARILDTFAREEGFESQYSLSENELILYGKDFDYNQIKKNHLPTSFVTPSSHRSNIDQFQLLSDASFNSFKPDLLNLLRYMDSDIEDVMILLSPKSTSSLFKIYIQHKKAGIAPVNTFGDGVRRLFHIALQLAKAKGGILLIDEIELTIHTEALTQSFDWLVKGCQDMNVQLFATTHSLEAIDAILATTEAELDLALYRLEPHEEQTKVVRHDWHRLKRLREELGQEVRW
ncbi:MULTISPECIES: AAA family ATPase [Spirulina sp. CCY15215]|uniref:AAA family ATPase n=1 Tax=Spirulina sp. CCY15215 TaxID=2767591 RepID=UPI00194E5400|nr:AAA family ATPase [Spirulina major]